MKYHFWIISCIQTFLVWNFSLSMLFSIVRRNFSPFIVTDSVKACFCFQKKYIVIRSFCSLKSSLGIFFLKWWVQCVIRKIKRTERVWCLCTFLSVFFVNLKYRNYIFHTNFAHSKLLGNWTLDKAEACAVLFSVWSRNQRPRGVLLSSPVCMLPVFMQAHIIGG